MRKARRGYILVQALVVIAGLLALMAMLAGDQRAATQGVQDRLRSRRAEWAASSAVARALASVQEADPNVVTLNDAWAGTGGSNGGEEFDLGGGTTFRMQIVDAGALVNVNHAPEEQLARLPLSSEQAHCLLDWREPKGQARPDGAKDAYYNTLPTPYNAKRGPLDTLDELLLVKGWTGQTLYQTPSGGAGGQTLSDAAGNALPLASLLSADGGLPNTRADGSPRLDLARPGVDAGALTSAGVPPEAAGRIAAQAPFPSFQALLTLPALPPEAAGPLLDAATFTEDARIEGKININTAPEAVLRTLPGGTAGLAAAIAARQAAGFRTLGELASVRGLSGDPARLALVAPNVCVGSDTWLVRAYGRSGGVGTAAEAVVGLRGGRARVLTWTRINTSGVPPWWGWDARPTATADAGDAR